MSWRKSVERGVNALALKQLDDEVAGAPTSPFGARKFGIDKMIADQADFVAKELEQDSDPVALARGTAHLALLLSWKDDLS